MFGKMFPFLLALVLIPLSHGQSIRLTSPISSTDRLPIRDQLRRADPLPVRPPTNFALLARSAGTIFSGTVSSIERRPASSTEAVETVAVTFRVERAIRGATPGTDLTISQWIGLWSAGQRYRIGERVFLFLYPKSKLGLTSVVAGPVGRFPVDTKGTITFSSQHRSIFETDPVLGGKSHAHIGDFALAVRQACEEE